MLRQIKATMRLRSVAGHSIAIRVVMTPVSWISLRCGREANEPGSIAADRRCEVQERCRQRPLCVEREAPSKGSAVQPNNDPPSRSMIQAAHEHLATMPARYRAEALL